MAFAAGWTPCLGPVLTGILAIAVTQSTGRGILLLLAVLLGARCAVPVGRVGGAALHGGVRLGAPPLPPGSPVCRVRSWSSWACCWPPASSRGSSRRSSRYGPGLCWSGSANRIHPDPRPTARILASPHVLLQRRHLAAIHGHGVANPALHADGADPAADAGRSRPWSARSSRNGPTLPSASCGTSYTHPLVGAFYRRAGLFDVFGSWWFTLITVLLFVSLVACLIPRTRAAWRSLRARPIQAREIDAFRHYAEREVTLPPAEAIEVARRTFDGAGSVSRAIPTARRSPPRGARSARPGASSSTGRSS